MTSAEHTFIEDTYVGPYRLRTRIASGGMAAVYLAVKHGPSGFAKQVALKRIRPELTEEPGFVDMFLDEARLAAAIEHSNVCAVLDFGEADGTPFLAMEYLMGESLRKLLVAFKNSGTVSLRRRQLMTARILADACTGLHAAHELRDDHDTPLHIVHRDISPQNIMITYDGVVKVMDFGIATWRLRDNSASTNPGTVKGKYAYMPPEQVRGESLDRRADLWAMGVVLFETLTLRRLFARKNTSETILEVLNAPIPRVTDIVPEIDPALADVIHRALQRDPSQRYETAAEMSRDLRQYLAQAGELIDSTELAKQMHALFPEDIAQKKRLTAFASNPHDGSPDIAAASQTSEIRPKARPNLTQEPPRVRPVLVASIVAAVVTLASGLAWFVGDADPPKTEPAASDESSGTDSRGSEASESNQLATASSSDATEPTETVATETDPPGAAPANEPASAREENLEAAPVTRMRERRRTSRGPPGTVNIATPGGWAEVYHRGRRIGQTPGSFRLPAGRQRLQLRPFGGSERRTVTVNVESGRTVRVQRSLR